MSHDFSKAWNCFLEGGVVLVGLNLEANMWVWHWCVVGWWYMEVDISTIIEVSAGAFKNTAHLPFLILNKWQLRFWKLSHNNLPSFSNSSESNHHLKSEYYSKILYSNKSLRIFKSSLDEYRISGCLLLKNTTMFLTCHRAHTFK